MLKKSALSLLIGLLLHNDTVLAVLSGGVQAKGTKPRRSASTDRRSPEVLAVAPPSGSTVDRTGWTVTCDSFQNGNECNKAIDGDRNTFWHSAYSPDVPLPHNITIDMKTSRNVNGVAMLPRQDGNENGFIATHELYLSSDGSTWGSPIAYGTWWSDGSEKISSFETKPARYIRLIARSSGNNGPWTSIAEINVYAAPSYSPPAAGLGQWGPTIDFPIVPVAAWVDPVSGKVVTFSSYSHDNNDGGPGGFTLTANWDPRTGAISQRKVTETGHDMFCPGMSFDTNGRMIVSGGRNAERTSIYNPSGDSWIPASNMRIPRGYEASTTTSEGKVFTIGGSWSGGYGGKNGEIYNPATNTWTLLPQCPVAPMLTADKQGAFRSDNHAWLFGWKKNTVFQAGPSKAMNWYTMSGNGGVSGAGLRNNDGDAMCGVAVMYDATNGKILTAGGAPDYQDTASTANAYIITIGNANTTAIVTATGNKMYHNRIFHHGVVLPNGDTFVTGGQQVGAPFFDTTPQLEPEIYSPSRNLWTRMLPNSIPRVYHSVALLLPDATVLVGGGGLCGGCTTNHFDAQIFTPPYLLSSAGTRLTRPTISGVSSSSVKVGTRITITTGGSISSASLVRYGSSTHSVNTDQRRIALQLLRSSSTRYSVAIPSDSGVATPGYWMLFVINSSGVPSVAKTIQITP